MSTTIWTYWLPVLPFIYILCHVSHFGNSYFRVFIPTCDCPFVPAAHLNVLPMFPRYKLHFLHTLNSCTCFPSVNEGRYVCGAVKWEPLLIYCHSSPILMPFYTANPTKRLTSPSHRCAFRQPR